MSDIQSPESEHIEEQTALEAVLRKAMVWVSANLTTVIYALAGILAIVAIFVYMNRASAGNTKASNLLLTATSPEEYQDIADSTPDSLLGMWTRLRQSEFLLGTAITNIFSNRKQGMEDLASAKAVYEDLGNQDGLPTQVRERVLIGLARIAEWECDGSPESIKTAIAAQQKVLDAFPDSMVMDYCKARIARLQKPEAAEFYQWFVTLAPKPAVTGGGPGTVPEIPDGLLRNIPDACLLYTSPSPRDQRGSRMPSSA